jgi:hypothetical protein
MIEIVLAMWAVVGLYAWARYRHFFREVSFRQPILTFESDDWGPGPPEDGDRLRELAACVAAHRDSQDRPAAVTLGVVLAVADTPADDLRTGSYRRLTLASDRFSSVRGAMLEGARKGVFFAQLHGAEHYWPPALLAAARRDDSVKDWLLSNQVPRTEALPSYVQSRWTDVSALPSKPLSDAEIAAASDDEVKLFGQIFGEAPTVAVPPTFVWDDRVERAWIGHGIRVVITPGCRHEARDAAGKLQPPTRIIRNGDRAAAAGAIYLVRDVYFEPTLGHRAETALRHIERRARLGRPALVEMHRFNFVDNVDQARSSLSELDRLLRLALGALPGLRFVSPRELAEAILRRDPMLVETRLTGRLAVWLRRLWEERRMRWLAVGSTALVPAAVVWFTASLAAGKLHVGAKE